MRTLSRAGITTLLVLITIPLALAFAGQRGPRRPQTQRAPRPPAFAMAGDAEEALAFLKGADTWIPFSNEIVSATFKASLYNEPPSATGDIGRVLTALRTTRDQLTTTYEVRWRQGAPFDEIVAIKAPGFDPFEMEGSVSFASEYYGSVFSFERFARVIVPPRFSQWLRAPIPPTAEERSAVAEERGALRQRQVEARLAERGGRPDDPRARGSRRGTRPAPEEPDGWVDTHDDKFHDYYNGSSVLLDNRFMGSQQTGLFNLEATLPDDRGAARAFRLFGGNPDNPRILDAFVYEQEESVNRPDLLLQAPYQVKWHYPGDPFMQVGFSLFYDPVYIAQVPPVDHTLEMDFGFGSNIGPSQFSSSTFVRHEWTAVGDYQVPSRVFVSDRVARPDGTVAMFVDPTQIAVSDWEIVTLDGERVRQESETEGDSVPSLTGDVAEARRLLAATDSRVESGPVERGTFVATYHPHLDNPTERTGDYSFSVTSGFDRNVPFGIVPVVADYVIGGDSNATDRLDRLDFIMGLGAQLRMTEFVSMAVPLSFESLLPDSPAGEVAVTLSEEGNLVRISGDTGYGGVTEIEIAFDPTTKLPLRTSFDAYDVYWEFEPTSGDRVRVQSLQFTNAIRRMFDENAGEVVEYEWGPSGGTLVGMSINGWDVRLSEWTGVD